MTDELQEISFWPTSYSGRERICTRMVRWFYLMTPAGFSFIPDSINGIVKEDVDEEDVSRQINKEKGNMIPVEEEVLSNSERSQLLQGAHAEEPRLKTP